MVLLQQLQQVDPELLEDEAQVVLVHKVVVHLNHQRARVRRLLGVAPLALLGAARHAEPLQQLHLHLGLLEEGGAVADDLDGIHLVSARLHLEHLPEGALAQVLQYLKGLAGRRDDLVGDGDDEVTQLIVEAAAPPGAQEGVGARAV